MKSSRCSVPQCTSWGKIDPDLTFHSFPNPNKQRVKQETSGTITWECRRKVWISLLKIDEPVTKNTRVCSRHFLESDYFLRNRTNGKSDNRRLKWTAVPSQNLPESSVQATTRTAVLSGTLSLNNTRNDAQTIPIPDQLIPVYVELRQMEELQCPKCSYTTEWGFQLEHHFRRDHQTVYDLEFNAIFDLGSFTCPICFFSDDCKLSICQHSNHNRCHPVYSCEHCQFTTHSSLHLMAHHKTCRDVLQGNTLNCKLCWKQAQSSFQTASTMCSRRWFKCEHCTYRSLSQLNFDRHVEWHQRWHNVPQRIRHKYLQAAPKEMARNNCSLCSYRGRDSYSLKRHMRRHADVKDIIWYKCDLCINVQFKQKSDLKKHKRFKHGRPDEVPWFKCVKCSYSTVRKNDLTKHMVTHAERSEIELFDCPYCPFRAKRQDILAGHVLIHLGRIEAQMLKCPYCNYEAKQSWQVRDHYEKEHAGLGTETLFRCNQCSFQSWERKLLVKHLQIHNKPVAPKEDKWLECKQPGCSYMCIAELQLSFNKHMLKHRADKNVQ